MAVAVPPREREEQAFAGNVEVPSVGGPSATTPDGAPADPGAAGPEGTAPGAADPGGTGGGTTGGTGGEQSPNARSEEHTFELQSLMRISYAVFCLKKKTTSQTNHTTDDVARGQGKSWRT